MITAKSPLTAKYAKNPLSSLRKNKPRKKTLHPLRNPLRPLRLKNGKNHEFVSVLFTAPVCVLLQYSNNKPDFTINLNRNQ